MIQNMLTKLTIRSVAIIVAALLLIVVIVWGPQMWRNHLTAKTQARLDHANVQAIEKTSAQTIQVVDDNVAKAKSIDQTVKEAKDEIRKAPDGYSNDAAIRSACRMRSHKHSERCAALRDNDTAKLEGRSAVR